MLTSSLEQPSLIPHSLLLSFIATLTWILKSRIFDALRWLIYPGRRADQWSIPRAVNSYLSYEREASIEVDIMWDAYNRLGLSRRHIGIELGYPAKLNRLRDTNRVNSKLTYAIARLAENDYDKEAIISGSEGTDISRVRETLKHFIRDWSDEGAKERQIIFAPILEELAKIPCTDREHCSVLVPGAGLSRLPWEISRLGLDTTANEVSAYMFLALRFLLSEQTTFRINQHTVHPYSHWFSHQRSNANLFRSMRFPDTLPRLDDRFHLLEGNFFDLRPDKINALGAILPSVGEGMQESCRANNEPSLQKSYTHIVTLFFIDTSPNILATLAQLYTLLKPGGIWINLGPLLWTSGGTTAMELSLEEVLRAIEMTGFNLKTLNPDPNAYTVDAKTRRVDCEYTADRKAMMKWVYEARFWIAEKI